jgi:hypothetical protein
MTHNVLVPLGLAVGEPGTTSGSMLQSSLASARMHPNQIFQQL